jgi:hypothetical protein
MTTARKRAAAKRRIKLAQRARMTSAKRARKARGGGAAAPDRRSWTDSD